MILDQNTIVLNPANGYYDEYTFDRYLSGGNILPGAVVGQSNIDLLDYYAGANANDAGRRAEFKASFPFFKYPYDEVNPSSGTGVAAEDTEFGKYLNSNPLGDSRFGHFADRYRHVITAGAPTGTTVDADYLDGVELHILVENALIGKSINHLFTPGEKTPVYTPVQGDRFLVRCYPGQNYKEGDALYLTDYNQNGVKGFYFTKKKPTGETTESYPTGAISNEIKAYAAESFSVPSTTTLQYDPLPIYIDAIDDSTTERPATTPLNGALVNLLRVRIA